MQEKVIAKMQALVDSRLKACPEASPSYGESGKVVPKVAEEIYKLNILLSDERERCVAKEAELGEANKEIQALKSQIWDLETGIGGKETLEKEMVDMEADLAAANKKVDNMQSDLATRDLRISALEEQLVFTARESSKEMSKLKTRLFDLEIALTKVENDPEALIGDIGFIGQNNDWKFTDDDENFEMPVFDPKNYADRKLFDAPIQSVSTDIDEGKQEDKDVSLESLMRRALSEPAAPSGSALNAANALKADVPKLTLDTLTEDQESARRRSTSGEIGQLKRSDKRKSPRSGRRDETASRSSRKGEETASRSSRIGEPPRDETASRSSPKGEETASRSSRKGESPRSSRNGPSPRSGRREDTSPRTGRSRRDSSRSGRSADRSNSARSGEAMNDFPSPVAAPLESKTPDDDPLKRRENLPTSPRRMSMFGSLLSMAGKLSPRGGGTPTSSAPADGNS